MLTLRLVASIHWLNLPFTNIVQASQPGYEELRFQGIEAVNQQFASGFIHSFVIRIWTDEANDTGDTGLGTDTGDTGLTETETDTGDTGLTETDTNRNRYQQIPGTQVYT